MEADYNIGDEVWGATFPASQGCHAEFVTASTMSISKKPKNLSHIEAASMPFVGLTAWSALMVSAGLSPEKLNRNAKFKKKILL